LRGFGDDQIERDVIGAAWDAGEFLRRIGETDSGAGFLGADFDQRAVVETAAIAEAREGFVEGYEGGDDEVWDQGFGIGRDARAEGAGDHFAIWCPAMEFQWLTFAFDDRHADFAAFGDEAGHGLERVDFGADRHIACDDFRGLGEDVAYQFEIGGTIQTSAMSLLACGKGGFAGRGFCGVYFSHMHAL